MNILTKGHTIFHRVETRPSDKVCTVLCVSHRQYGFESRSLFGMIGR